MNIAELIGQKTSGNSGVVLPASYTNSPFILQHHPNMWILVDLGDQSFAIPHLRHFKLRPGVNGVKWNNGRANAEEALSHAASIGWRSIPYSALAAYPTSLDVAPWNASNSGKASYVARTKTARAWHYHTVWDSFSIYGNAVSPLSDRNGYARFCQELMNAGVVEQPRDSVLEILEERYRKRAHRVRLPSDPQIKQAQELARAAAVEIADIVDDPEILQAQERARSKQKDAR